MSFSFLFLEQYKNNVGVETKLPSENYKEINTYLKLRFIDRWCWVCKFVNNFSDMLKFKKNMIIDVCVIFFMWVM